MLPLVVFCPAQYGYPNVSLALNATGRPILYACSWPAYYESSGMFNQTEWGLLSEYCNYWRNYDDINDDFDSIADIIEWWGNHQDTIAPISGPGHWNDPDMVSHTTTRIHRLFLAAWFGILRSSRHLRVCCVVLFRCCAAISLSLCMSAEFSSPCGHCGPRRCTCPSTCVRWTPPPPPSCRTKK